MAVVSQDRFHCTVPAFSSPSPELVDCDKIDEGCNGGLPSQAYKAIQRLGGLETEKDYPYEGRGEKCDFDKSEVRAYINGSVKISKDEDGKYTPWTSSAQKFLKTRYELKNPLLATIYVLHGQYQF